MIHTLTGLQPNWCRSFWNSRDDKTKQKGGRKVKRGRARKDAESNGGNTPQQDPAAGGAVGHG